jgi:hypothetical protein
MATYHPSWRWRIVLRGKPMGVRIEGGGFTTYERHDRPAVGHLQISLISLSANVFGPTVDSPGARRNLAPSKTSNRHGGSFLRIAVFRD